MSSIDPGAPQDGQDEARPRRASASGRSPAARPPGAHARPAQRRVRVQLLLDADALEDLEHLCRYRRGPQTRSEVVREAIDWLRAREASWLVRAHRADQNRRRRERESKRARRLSGAERERQDAEAELSEALDIVERARKSD